jgi:hypothetical protein
MYAKGLRVRDDDDVVQKAGWDTTFVSGEKRGVLLLHVGTDGKKTETKTT